MSKDEGAYVPRDEYLSHLKLVDLRPKEYFERGCRVRCLGTYLRDGMVIKTDADLRLGYVSWPGVGSGWWYLKDLVITGYPVSAEVKKILMEVKNENINQV